MESEDCTESTHAGETLFIYEYKLLTDSWVILNAVPRIERQWHLSKSVQ